VTYAWSAENYPTRARATGFALVDGVGHLGGGVGILLIAPLIDDSLSHQVTHSSNISVINMFRADSFDARF
jgi:hypothetical protein